MSNKLPVQNQLLGKIDPQDFDTNYRPQDDLFRFVNGKWLAHHKIPDDRPIDGTFYQLRDRSEKQVREIIESCVSKEISGTEAQLIADLYTSYLDEEKVEADAAPILAKLDEPLKQATSKAQLATAWAWHAKSGGINGFFGIDVDVDLNDSTRYCSFIGQDGLGLPERAFYLEDIHANIRPLYKEHMARMFTLADWANAEQAKQMANQVMEFETAIAKLHWENVKTRDADAINNPMSWTDFTQSAPGFDFDEFLKQAGLEQVKNYPLIVCMPDFFTMAAQLWQETDLEVLRWWLRWQLLNSLAGLLGKNIVNANFEFYGRTLSGSKEIRQRWRRAVSAVESALGEAVGKIYVKRHFPPTATKSMEVLVQNLIDAYHDSILSLDWMGEETRQKALEKLSQFTPKIGHPRVWRDLTDLDLSAPTLVEKTIASRIFEAEYHLSKLGQAVDKEEWHMNAQTVNAYYNPTQNEIVFPAAILQPPFFDPQADPAVNYGAIGAVIGHEIGHGFDDQGSKFDGLGNMVDWWNAKDREEFEKRTAVLIDQYSALTPLGLDEEHKVNGQLTIGENIGDLGGLSIAWKAYLRHLESQGITDHNQAPVIEGYTGAQRFLLSWARAWRSKSRPEFAKQLLAIDPHSPAEFRCNAVVANMDLFAQTFETRPTDALWIPPEQRVKIW